MTKADDFYARLGLPLDATPEEVRHAYRLAARRLHPDLNEMPGDTEFFLGVQEAYDILSNPEQRAAYNSSLPPERSAAPGVNVSSFLSRPSVRPGPDAQLLYALVEFSAPPNFEKTVPVPPLNICILLDCSTSMRGEVLDTVKLSAIELVRQLKPNDLFSLVAFNDRADVLIPAGMVRNSGRTETRIRMLRAGGGTEIFQGLEAAFAEVRRNHRKTHLSHILILTDGHTYGDERNCFAIAGKAAELGIGISAIGIGHKWNDVFLDTLASRTGGSSVHVESPEQIRHYMREKFMGLGKTYADPVSYQFDCAEGVSLEFAFRLRPDLSPLEVTTPIQFGSIPRTGSLGILFEFKIEQVSDELKVLPLAQGFVSLETPVGESSHYTTRLNLELPVEDTFIEEDPPSAIMQAMARLTLYRLQEKAYKEVEVGKFTEASRRLQNLATHLLAQGENELARAAMQEAANIQNNHLMSQEGSKRIKYGTRALLLSGSDFDDITE